MFLQVYVPSVWYFIVAALLTVGFICILSSLASTQPAPPKLSQVETLVAQMISAAEEDGRSDWNSDRTCRVTYTLLGHQPGQRQLWVRYVFERDFKTAFVECANGVTDEQQEQAMMIRDAFIRQGVPSSISYACRQPPAEEMFVYPAPGTEQRV